MSALLSGPDTTTAMTDALLKLEHRDTFYGPVQVHFDVNVAVGRGQIVSLLGGNASGKSTTMKLILGLMRPRRGVVRFDGGDVTALATPQRVRRGIAAVPEARRQNFTRIRLADSRNAIGVFDSALHETEFSPEFEGVRRAHRWRNAQHVSKFHREVSLKRQIVNR